MPITKHSVVTIDYTLKDPAGKLLDQSKPGTPLVYLHGVGGLIAGLEAELEGKDEGASLVAVIPPEKAYGVRDNSLTQTISRDAFKGVPRIEHGMRFRGDTPQGPRILTVVGFERNGDVKVDANHPLAGVTLHFTVKVLEIRDATQEEISHGHVHGPGGHHHH